MEKGNLANFDFQIPEEFDGKDVKIKSSYRDVGEIVLSIPVNARFISVDPLEEEEEYSGCQDDSWWLELRYYNKDGKPIKGENIENKIICSELMRRFEEIFKPLYE